MARLFLQSKSHEYVFAAGDVANMRDCPRPKSGVFAVRQAEPLLKNLRCYLENKCLVPYRPQSAFLSLIGTGDGRAVASRRWLAHRSRLMWHLKDRIDRRFMRKFTVLPQMGTNPSGNKIDDLNSLSHQVQKLERKSEMRCVGCAAKVGSETLRRVLDRLRSENDFLTKKQEIRFDSGDDAAVFSFSAQKLLVQSVDYFPGSAK